MCTNELQYVLYEVLLHDDDRKDSVLYVQYIYYVLYGPVRYVRTFV